MLDSLLTEAARRAIDGAAILAARAGAPVREPEHLLWVLALDESQASEVLTRGGVTRQELTSFIPLRTSVENGDELSPAAVSETQPSIPDSPDFRRVLAVAAQIASRQGGHAQVGTEELLVGLASVESPASRFLARFGLTPQALAEPNAEPAAQSPDALSVDFDIQWQQQPEVDRTGALRILDAALNRAGEGLRVLEDFARFALDDAHLTRRLKQCRHDLRQPLAGLPLAELLRARDTQADVGARITTRSEVVRTSTAHVAQAAFKRVEEAVRSLEEFSKLWSALAAEQFERLRYRLYTLEKALFLAELNRRALGDRRLYLLVTESLCQTDLESAVRGACSGGVAMVQCREKNLPERTLVEHARRLREWARDAGAIFIMNDRADLAVAVDADGVHLGQEDLNVKEARQIVGSDRLVGVSTHTIEQARRAVLDGADYIGVGPVFASSTKEFDAPAGVDFVKQVAAEISLPWFAIGGINLDNVDQVLEAGGRRIAVSHAILAASDPSAAAKALSERLSGAAQP
jgi:thiamine-phosphate pyrophosphorylase